MLDTNTEVEEEAKLQADDEDINPGDATTFVPVVARKLSENDTIRKTVQRARQRRVLNRFCRGPRAEMNPSMSSALRGTSRVPFRHSFPRVQVTLLPQDTTPLLLAATSSTC